MQGGSSLGLAGDATLEDHPSCTGQCWGEKIIGGGKEGGGREKRGWDVGREE